MAVENDFLPFAAGAGANVMGQAAYAALPNLTTGVVAGVADPTLYNKSTRQATLWAYFLSQFVVNETGQPALDNGDLVTPLNNLVAALSILAKAQYQAPQTTVLTSGSGTYATPTAGGLLPLYLDVEMIGGGSGGGGSGSGGGIGAAGSGTTFGGLSAGGAPATPANTSTTFPAPAVATGGDTNISGALGGPPSVLNLTAANNSGQAACGASSPLGTGGTPGTINLAAATVASQAASGFGAGGGAGGNNTTGATYNSGWGGNAGAFLRKRIIAPAASYTWQVGPAGAGGAAGTSGGFGGAGSPGYISIVARWQ